MKARDWLADGTNGAIAGEDGCSFEGSLKKKRG